CARNCLKDKEECPSCRKPASDTHLRKNVALESAVKAWAAARDFALRLAKREAERLQRDATKDTPRPRKRQRLARSSGGSSSDEVQIVEGPSTSGRPRLRTKNLVDCPVCQRRVPLQIINQHIDSRCKLTAPPSPRRPKGKAKQEWSRILGGTGPPAKGRDRDKDRCVLVCSSSGEYLPTVSYHTLKDKRVQELLHEHGLPTTGDRPAWIRRHRQWVTLYNANLDRAPADRHTPDQLRRALQKWEATEGTATGGASGNGGAGKKKAGEVRDVVAYQTAHRAEFAKLVEAARPKRSPEATGTGEVAGRSDGANGEDETAETQQTDEDEDDGSQDVMNRMRAS
ncbi:hypothetical protein DAEQUDRAFT_672676, partial [Daedalea quercina L-15889]